MKNSHTRRGVTQMVVKNRVILNLLQDLPRLPLRFASNVRGRFQTKFAMTAFKAQTLSKKTFRAPLCSGFTLRPSSSRNVLMRDIGATHTL